MQAYHQPCVFSCFPFPFPSSLLPFSLSVVPLVACFSCLRHCRRFRCLLVLFVVPLFVFSPVTSSSSSLLFGDDDDVTRCTPAYCSLFLVLRAAVPSRHLPFSCSFCSFPPPVLVFSQSFLFLFFCSVASTFCLFCFASRHVCVFCLLPLPTQCLARSRRGRVPILTAFLSAPIPSIPNVDDLLAVAYCFPPPFSPPTN